MAGHCKNRSLTTGRNADSCQLIRQRLPGRLFCIRKAEFRPGKSQPIDANAKPPRALTRHERRARVWLRKWGPKTCLLSWLPVVGDPLCAVAGWLRMPFWPCLVYMAIGKLARYTTMTAGLLYLVP